MRFHFFRSALSILIKMYFLGTTTSSEPDPKVVVPWKKQSLVVLSIAIIRIS
jgi:hypothetical protein